MNGAEGSHLQLVWDNSKGDAFFPDPGSPKLPAGGALSEQEQRPSRRPEDMSAEEIRLWWVFPGDFDEVISDPGRRGRAGRAYRILKHLFEPQATIIEGEVALPLSQLAQAVVPRDPENPRSTLLDQFVGINAVSTVVEDAQKVVDYKASQIEAADNSSG
ncbi:MAG TPA: hypothetical protein VN778_00555 [Verrucomicrobiae bacterium]|nr:hypothetical protein [Verrucomicrobiae bacterium]